LKIPILEGRDFTEADDRKAPLVMIVDQAFARRFYGGASPIGRRVQVCKKRWTIAGVVRDSKYFSFTEGSRPHFYLPFRQSWQLGQNIVFFIRSKTDPEAVISTMRREAVAIDPNASSFAAAPLAEHNLMQLLPLRVASGLLAALGVIAFLLSGIGLYGVMSYSVSERTREFGIHMALGARPRDVVSGVAGNSLMLTAMGLAAGLLLAVGATRLIGGILVGISPLDPVTFALASLFLTVVAVLASLRPAYRATQVDPAVALRDD
jgi:hypothetical protein